VETSQNGDLAARVAMETTSIALGVGFHWGSGMLSLADGTSHRFRTQGLKMGSFSISSVSIAGAVYYLANATDFEGTYRAQEASSVAGSEAEGMVMRNDNGVVIKLDSVQDGVDLTLGVDTLSIELEK